MKKSVYFYIQSAFSKIRKASIEGKGCYLTFNECAAISIHDGIPDAIGDFIEWEFDKKGQLIEEPILENNGKKFDWL